MDRIEDKINGYKMGYSDFVECKDFIFCLVGILEIFFGSTAKKNEI